MACNEADKFYPPRCTSPLQNQLKRTVESADNLGRFTDAAIGGKSDEQVARHVRELGLLNQSTNLLS